MLMRISVIFGTVVLWLFVLCASQVALAAIPPITVTSLSGGSNDGTGCTLRDAIQAVNTAMPVGQCIAGTAGSVVNTIILQVRAISFAHIDSHSAGAFLPALVAGRSLNIYGSSPSRTNLSASAMCGQSSGRFLEVHTGAALLVADVDFSCGFPLPSDALGGIGGAIANFGTFYLVRSHLFQNSAYTSHLTGAVYNHGSAIYTGPDAQFSANDVTFDSNVGGGALYVDTDPGNGSATIVNCAFVANQGSAIHNVGSLTVTNATFFNNDSVPGPGFSSQLVGAISNTAPGTLDLSFASIVNTSIAKTYFTELDIGPNSTARIKSSLFSTPPASALTTNCSVSSSATVSWSGVSISSDATCAGGSNLINTNPGVDGALADNGGPTQTLKLLSGSPAIHIDSDCLDTSATPVTTDQRGYSRPSSRCDAGAYEDTIFSNGFE